MKITEAAQIIKTHVEKRDAKAMQGGLNTTAYNMRMVGDKVRASDEDISGDVLAGRGPGTGAAARRIVRVAKILSPGR